MTDDLDRLEEIAKKATPGKWQWDDADGSFGSLQDEESHYVTVAYALSGGDSGGAIIDIDEPDATHIAAFSPDVVLRLIARLRAAEESVRFLWAAWADAEGSGQPKDAVFGVLETYGDPDFERLGAPVELQRAIFRIVKPDS